jgi:hypothetical protein
VKLRIRKEPSWVRHKVAVQDADLGRNKRRATHFEWAADRSQALPSGIPSFASGSLGSSISRAVPAQPTLSSSTPGQDVSHRLSLSNQGSLGIRNIMDDASSRRSGTSTSGVDSWAAHQRTSHQTTHQTTHQPQNWPMPNWSYGTTPLSTSYSMPPATSSYELTSGRTSYNDASYSNTHHTVPSSAYTLDSSNHSQPGHTGLRGSDSSYFMGSTSPFTHMQNTHTGASAVGSHDTSNVASFDMSFSTTTSMATGGMDAFGYQHIGGGLRSFPVTSGSDASEHFV